MKATYSPEKFDETEIREVKAARSAQSLSAAPGVIKNFRACRAHSWARHVIQGKAGNWLLPVRSRIDLNEWVTSAGPRATVV